MRKLKKLDLRDVNTIRTILENDSDFNEKEYNDFYFSCMKELKEEFENLEGVNHNSFIYEIGNIPKYSLEIEDSKLFLKSTNLLRNNMSYSVFNDETEKSIQKGIELINENASTDEINVAAKIVRELYLKDIENRDTIDNLVDYTQEDLINNNTYNLYYDNEFNVYEVIDNRLDF